MNLALLVMSYGIGHRLFEFAWKGQLRVLHTSMVRAPCWCRAAAPPAPVHRPGTALGTRQPAHPPLPLRDAARPPACLSPTRPRPLSPARRLTTRLSWPTWPHTPA
jgi:hypothetical protein